MLVKGVCSAKYFQLTLCTSFQQQSTLFSVVSVREFIAELTPLTYCSLGGIVGFDDFFHCEKYVYWRKANFCLHMVLATAFGENQCWLVTLGIGIGQENCNWCVSNLNLVSLNKNKHIIITCDKKERKKQLGVNMLTNEKKVFKSSKDFSREIFFHPSIFLLVTQVRVVLVVAPLTSFSVVAMWHKTIPVYIRTYGQF